MTILDAAGHSRPGLGTRRLTRCVMVLLALARVLGVAQGAVAGPTLPSAPTVKAGTVSVTPAGGATLTINQASSRAIIDWSSFSIGQGGTVVFNNGAGATLNRVTGATISAIDGRLTASGDVFLLNPNGVIIGKSGVVNVGGSFVASTLDLPDADFMAGGALTLSGAGGAQVINLGQIGALGGDVVLTAAQVANQGSITAPRGTVGLVAGAQVLLKDQADQDGLFSVRVGGAGSSVTNAGAISAAAEKKGFRPLRLQALTRVAEGVTSLEEAQRKVLFTLG